MPSVLAPLRRPGWRYGGWSGVPSPLDPDSWRPHCAATAAIAARTSPNWVWLRTGVKGVGTGVANVTRPLQSGAAGSRAALRGFRAALLAALRCHPGSPAWQPGCQQGSPAPIHGSPAPPSWQPCAANLAALRCHPGSPALPRWQPCAAALRVAAGLPHAGSPARHWQPCVAAPGWPISRGSGRGEYPAPSPFARSKR